MNQTLLFALPESYAYGLEATGDGSMSVTDDTSKTIWLVRYQGTRR